jgi:hypothetical protein
MDSAGHGILTADVIDIFWVDANGIQKCAYGATVGTVAGTAVPFTGAGGDVLPAQDYDVTADVEVPLDVDFDGDKLQILAAMSTRVGKLQFLDAGSAELDASTLVPNEAYSFIGGAGGSNPLTGNPVDDVIVSNGDAVNAATFKLAVLYDSDT